MKKRSFIAIFVVFISVTSLWAMSKDTGKSAMRMELDASKAPGDVTFVFEKDELEAPLLFKGGMEGTIYYVTRDKQRHYIQGKPDEVYGVDKGFHGKWNMDDRNVDIVFKTPDGVLYDIEFKADKSGDILQWGFYLQAQPDEFFTGLFERTVDGNQKESWAQGITTAMDLHGERVEMIIKPTLGLYCPFYISDRGYSLFVQGTWPGVYDFCKENPDLVHVEFEGPDLKMQLHMSSDPAKLIQRHSLHVGPTILPPKWAFTHWRWRDDHTQREEYYDGTPVGAPYNSELVEDVLMMEAFDIPCGVYWVDRPWCVGDYGYDDFEWDPQRLPNHEAMIDWVESKGMRFLLWIAPWVNGDMARVANERGFTMQNQRRVEERPLIDYTNPSASLWWQDGIYGVLKAGVRGFKLDRAEEIVPEDRRHTVFDGRTNREIRNHYPVLYLKATYDVSKKVYPDGDFVLMPRAGYTNSSRYGVFWGGDIGSPPEGLRAAIIAQLRCSVIGFPIWGSDTGGYWAGDLDREVLARWLGFSCFSPLMEVGPTENRGFWDMKKQPHYDTELIAIWRLYAKIHHQLLDYTYELAKEARDTGMPMVRPLFMVTPDDPQAWQQWQTYLYGPDILVSAIWKKGITSHTVYLPKGDTWVDAWDPSKEYDGGQEITVDAPMYKTPIFVKKSSKIDLGDIDGLYRESLDIAAVKPDIKALEQKEFGK